MTVAEHADVEYSEVVQCMSQCVAMSTFRKLFCRSTCAPLNTCVFYVHIVVPPLRSAYGLM